MNVNQSLEQENKPELEEGSDKEMFGCVGIFVFIPLLPFIMKFAENFVFTLIASI